jgi:hypothetical protein
MGSNCPAGLRHERVRPHLCEPEPSSDRDRSTVPAPLTTVIPVVSEGFSTYRMARHISVAGEGTGKVEQETKNGDHPSYPAVQQ